jgi:hypothetical protein
MLHTKTYLHKKIHKEEKVILKKLKEKNKTMFQHHEETPNP